MIVFIAKRKGAPYNRNLQNVCKIFAQKKNDQNCCNASSNLNRPLELNELEQSVRLKRLFIWCCVQSRLFAVSKSPNSKVIIHIYNNYDPRVMELSVIATGVKCT